MLAKKAHKPLFLPLDAPSNAGSAVGFRLSGRGAHTSRTMMLAELSETLASVPASSKRDAYISAIVSDNCTHKSTAATRKLTSQRLTEFYALDPRVPLFRVLRRLWDISPAGRPLLALLTALARDPRFLKTASYIMDLDEGAAFNRDALKGALLEQGDARLNDAVLDKVARNAASSWVQSGHLTGRTFKKRSRVHPTAAVAAYAAYLAFHAGMRGVEIFRSGWLQVIDASPANARDLLLEAKQLGLIDFRMAGDVMTLGLDRLDPSIGKA